MTFLRRWSAAIPRAVGFGVGIFLMQWLLGAIFGDVDLKPTWVTLGAAFAFALGWSDGAQWAWKKANLPIIGDMS
jgi:hypothetical protein